MTVFVPQNLRNFREIFFLRTFAQFFPMKRNEFCAGFRKFFSRNLRKTGSIFLRIFGASNTKSLAQFFLRNLRKTGSITQNVTF